MKQTTDYFALNIKKLRKSMGLTQQEMANIIGVRKTTICNYESGYAKPTINTLKTIMDIFRLPATYFIPDKDARKKVSQTLYGITIPFYLHTNIHGLETGDKMLMDSPLTLPMQISSPTTSCIATNAPDNAMNLCGIKKGCAIIINTHAEPMDGKIFAAIREGELIIRKFHNNQSGTYMSAESSRIPSGMSIEEIPRENFKFLGIVTKIISDI